MIQNLSIEIVDIINNELICAAKNSRSGEVMLFYGIYNPDGKLDITVKSNVMEDINFILNSVQ